MISRRSISVLVLFWVALACSTLGCGGADDSPSAEKSPEAMIQEATAMIEEAKAIVSETKEKEVEAAQVAAEALEAAKAKPSSGFTKFDALMAGLSIFVLAVFVGFEVITKVPPTLHTPLMSGSNAISGITVVGALLVAGRSDSGFAWLLGLLAVVFAMINVIGGFWVTHRMLSMFKR